MAKPQQNTRLIPALALAVLAFVVTPALATPDPMVALEGRPAGTDPMDPMTALTAAPAKTEITASADFGGLPEGPGAEETFYQCTACHSTEIIKQQKVTDKRWDELWAWMVEKQGMVEPDAADKTVILAYLKTHFSSEK